MSSGYKWPYTYEEFIDGLVRIDVLGEVELSYPTEGGVESHSLRLCPGHRHHRGSQTP